MALLGGSVLAILVGVGLFGLLAFRLWMKLVWRVVMLGLALTAFAGLCGVVWLWIQHA
jgi:hypothetical protein